MEITDAIEDAKELLGIKVLTSENIRDIEELIQDHLEEEARDRIVDTMSEVQSALNEELENE